MQVVLFRVLYAYTHVKDNLGYTQGMSDVAWLLLHALQDEVATYSVFKSVILDKKRKLGELFKNASSIMLIIETQNKILGEYPKISKHLASVGFISEENDIMPHCMYAMEWYLVLWSRILPFELSVFIFDVFITYGYYKTVYAAAFSLFELLSNKLKKLNDIMAVMQVLKKPIDELEGVTPKHFLKTMKKWYKTLLKTSTISDLTNEGTDGKENSSETVQNSMEASETSSESEASKHEQDSNIESSPNNEIQNAEPNSISDHEQQATSTTLMHQSIETTTVNKQSPTSLENSPEQTSKNSDHQSASHHRKKSQKGKHNHSKKTSQMPSSETGQEQSKILKTD